MSKHSEMLRRSRRAFLKGIALVGGTTVLVSVSTTSASGSEELTDKPAEEPPQSSRGYHMTPHIATYYAKAAL